jgi:alcohol dehydrogenase class IV
MLRNWQYTFPARIQFGRGTLRKLGLTAKGLGQKALLVSYDGESPTAEYCRAATKSLTEAGMSVAEFFEVLPEPSIDVAAAGAEAVARSGADMVVAVGGGSVIDAAKGIALIARQGGAIPDYADTSAERRPVAAALPIVAVPTTAGTGAEATQVAVFSSEMGKLSVTAAPLRPLAVVVDSDLTLSCSPEVTAACGADALAHAMETCLSRAATPISTALAMHAVGLIAGQLARAVEQPDDRAAREALSTGALLAGMAINESGTTMTHAIAHAVGAIFDMPHGRSVALATPLNLRYNRDACRDVYGELARRCGLAAESPDALADALIEHVGGLLRRVGLRVTIPTPAAEVESLARRIARDAFAMTPTPLRLNPRPIDESALAALLAVELLESDDRGA